MPLNLKEGEFVPIPCRHCGRAVVMWRLVAGRHSVPCGKCSGQTEVRADRVAGALEIRTAPLSHPKSTR